MLDDFLSCSRKAYYRLNKPELAVQNKEMVIGEIVHSAIEKYWELIPAACFYAIGEIKSRVDGDKTSENFALNCIHNYFEHFRKHLTYDGKAEVKFKIPLEKDVFIVGKMDRVDAGNVFDWKTARTPPTNISNSVQFAVYNWAYKRLYNATPSGVYYAALTNGKLIRYMETPAAESILFDEVVPQALKAIRGRDYPRNGLFRKACFRCSYLEACTGGGG